MANHVMTAGERMCLHSAAHDLRTEFRGIFSEQTIETLLLDSYAELAAHASVTRWLALGSERFARQRLRTFARAQIPSGEVSAVLFVCRHNAGRSQMALGWLAHLAGDRAVGWSVGSDPMPGIDPAVVAVMAEAGIDISLVFSKPWTDEFVLAADVVVTMGGDACPLLPGRHYEDWELCEPAGKTLEEIRSIRDQIKDRVMNFVDKLPEPRLACRTAASLP
jgi:arsenate reductase (thioredoxin)